MQSFGSSDVNQKTGFGLPGINSKRTSRLDFESNKQSRERLNVNQIDGVETFNNKRDDSKCISDKNDF